jgi:hypothetical protein|tara:strand:- start:2720 stop:3505 length:786 start_codon:yes stop_codon:yes gene_type:complete
MKRLYEFVLKKKETVEKEVPDVNKDGEEITAKKTVEEEVEKKFFLRRPTRAMLDEGELYYGVELGKAIRAGMITRPLLHKRYTNDGGIMNDLQQKAFDEITKELREIYAQQEEINVIDEKKRTNNQKKKHKELEDKAKPYLETMRRYNMAEESIFEDTAESRARNKAILWWVLFMSYNDDETPFFDKGELEDRLEKYDEIDDGQDPFLTSVVAEFTYNISLWYFARPNSKEQFDELKKNVTELDEEEEKTEEKPKKEAKKK